MQDPEVFYPFEVYLRNKETKIGKFLDCTLDITNPEAVEVTLENGIIDNSYKYLFEQQDIQLVIDIGEIDHDWIDVNTGIDLEMTEAPGRRYLVVRWKSIGKYPNYNYITNG